MKFNLFILIIVVVLGVYAGLNINKEPVISDVSEETTTKTESREKEKIAKPKDEKLKEKANQEYKYKIMYQF